MNDDELRDKFTKSENTDTETESTPIENNTESQSDIPNTSDSIDSIESTESATEAETEPTAPVVQSGGNKSSKGKKVLLILGIVLLVAAAGFAVYMFTKKDSPTTNNAQQTEVKNDIPLLRYGLGEGTMNEFYPSLEIVEATLNMNRQIFEGLVGFQEKTKITPLLASSWANPDETTWVFTLKEGVKFHTGNPLTPQDVVYSYEVAKKNEGLAADVLPTIKSVEAVGENQVKITTNEVDPILLNRLTNLFIVDDAGKDKDADPAYGTGPYTLKPDTTATAEAVELVAFDGYHGGHIYTRELHMNVYLDSETDEPGAAEKRIVADFQEGKLDIVGFLSGANLQAAKDSNFELFTVDDVAVYQVAMNVNKKDSPLQKKEVREAIYRSVDTEALLKVLGRTGTVANQGVPPYIPGYAPSIQRPQRDVAAAKKLLTDAGYPDGTSITLTVFTAAQDAGEEIKRQLGESGITVELDVQSDGSALQSAVAEGTLEAFYYADGSFFADGSDVFARMFQSANYNSKEIDELQKQASTTLDQPKRLQLLQEVSESAMNDTAIIPLYVNQPNWAMNKPFVMTQDLLISDIGVLFYKVYLKG